MPRHLIGDAHEWSNEIPTVPDDHCSNLQPKERVRHKKRGKKTLLSLTLVTIAEDLPWCSVGGRAIALETPPLGSIFGTLFWKALFQRQALLWVCMFCTGVACGWLLAVCLPQMCIVCIL